MFLSALIDASGIPFPGRLLLVAVGAMSGTADGSVAILIVLAAVAAIVMDHVWWLAAVRGSDCFLRLFRRLTGLPGRRGGPVVHYVVR